MQAVMTRWAKWVDEEGTLSKASQQLFAYALLERPIARNWTVRGNNFTFGDLESEGVCALDEQGMPLISKVFNCQHHRHHCKTPC